ncbi:MAG: hypothetical protein ACR2MX_09535 [Cyclobacteriaceae bacterium]
MPRGKLVSKSQVHGDIPIQGSIEVTEAQADDHLEVGDRLPFLYIPSDIEIDDDIQFTVALAPFNFLAGKLDNDLLKCAYDIHKVSIDQYTNTIAQGKFTKD